MRRFLTVLPFVLFATSVMAADSWVVFNDPDGMFTAEMPFKPKTVGDSITNTDGNKVAMLEYTVDRGANAMIVIVSDLTRYPNADPDKVIEGAVGGAKGSAVTVTGDTVDTLDGQTGRKVDLIDKDGNQIEDRIFFVQLKLYQIMYVIPGKPTAQEQADVARFTRNVHFTH